MTKTTPLALIALLAFASAAHAQVSRKEVPSDNRITDATIDFDDAKYPAGKVSSLTFWGFIGAKTDESPDQDRLCDMDVAELASNTAQAARRAGAKNGEFTVQKRIVESTGEACDGREEPKGGTGGYHGPSCTSYTSKHCAAKVATTSAKLRLQYKRIDGNGPLSVCRAAIVKEMDAVGTTVIDSTVVVRYDGNGAAGCQAKVLEIVAAD